jgi:iron complex outermembrane receptor protein
MGDPNLRAEKMVAYELGWRGLLRPSVSADAALFYFDYRDAISTSPGVAQPMGPFTPWPSYILQPVYFTNYAKARTYGGELAMSWQVTEAWKLRANYAYFESKFSLDNGASPNTLALFQGAYPRHQAMLWSMHQLTPTVQFDLNLRYVGNVNLELAPGDYLALDARIGWKAQKNMELALVGRNLLDHGHLEFGRDQWSTPTQNPREVFATVRLDF